MKLFIIQKELQIFSTTVSIPSAEKTHAKIKYSGYLSNKSHNSFFLSTIEKEEIKMIGSSLDIWKATGPYSIPSKVLKLIKSFTYDQLANLWNLTFTTGSFPTLLKAAKIVLIKKTW